MTTICCSCGGEIKVLQQTIGHSAALETLCLPNPACKKKRKTKKKAKRYVKKNSKTKSRTIGACRDTATINSGDIIQ